MVAAAPLSWHLLLLLGLGGGFIFPLGIPPGPEDPATLSVAPAECQFYVAWSGTAKPSGQSKNQTEQLLAEPELQKFFAELESRLVRAIRQGPGRRGAEGSEVLPSLVELGKSVLTHPGAVYLAKVEFEGRQPPRVSAGALFGLGDEVGRAQEAIRRLTADAPPGAIREIQSAGKTWQQIQLPDPPVAVTWGVAEGHFLVAVGEESPEAMLARIKGPPPEWLSGVLKRLPVPRRATVSYLNVKGIAGVATKAGGPQVGRVLAAMGIDRMQSAASVTGLDDRGFVSRSLLALDEPGAGLFAALSEKPLAAADLAPIPRDATWAVAARIEPDRVWKTILALVGRIDPRAADELDRDLGQMQNDLDLDLREDVLKPLGDVWCLYNSPGEGGLLFTGTTLVVKVNDPKRLAKAHERLLARLRAEMDRGGGSRRRAAPAILRATHAGQEIFTFLVPEEGFPFAPSWCLTEKELIVALYPQNVRACLSRKPGGSLAEAPEVARALEGKDPPLLVSYKDTRQLFQLAYPLIQMGATVASGELRRQGIDLDVSMLPSAAAIGPHLQPAIGVVRRTPAGIETTVEQTIPAGGAMASAPVAAALLLPAVQGSREAARRSQSMNNLKQIALAMHNYHDTYGRLPPAYVADKEGKPLLSWRVLILPYMEQEPLYRAFHLDEPWDSPHNRKLSQTPVPVYRSPNSTAPPNKTNYLAIRHERSIFPGAKPIGFAGIIDGTSNTIMVVEANDASAVEWARPDDLVPDPQNPARGLVGMRPGGFVAAMADGSVHFVPASLDPATLWALFTRDGSEVINLEELIRPDRPPGPPRKFPGPPPRAKFPSPLKAAPKPRVDSVPKDTPPPTVIERK